MATIPSTFNTVFLSDKIISFHQTYLDEHCLLHTIVYHDYGWQAQYSTTRLVRIFMFGRYA